MTGDVSLGSSPERKEKVVDANSSYEVKIMYDIEHEDYMTDYAKIIDAKAKVQLKCVPCYGSGSEFGDCEEHDRWICEFHICTMCYKEASN